MIDRFDIDYEFRYALPCGVPIMVFQISGIHREEHSWKEPLALQEELQVKQIKFA
jgi:hypothetical protein